MLSTVDGYTLRYMRAVDADCNLNLEGRNCWQRVQSEYSRQDKEMPACKGYDHIAELVGTDDVESVIAYAVEARLFPRPIVRVIAGAAECWASQ